MSRHAIRAHPVRARPVTDTGFLKDEPNLEQRVTGQAQKKPTRPDTLRCSTPSAYCLTSRPALPSCPLTSHPMMFAGHSTPRIYEINPGVSARWISAKAAMKRACFTSAGRDVHRPTSPVPLPMPLDFSRPRPQLPQSRPSSRWRCLWQRSPGLVPSDSALFPPFCCVSLVQPEQITARANSSV